MQTSHTDILKCWICGDIANSKEHKIKKSDIISMYGSGSYKNENELCFIGKNVRNIQGANSRLLKYNDILCANCNNARTQPFDKAYEIFINYINKNKTEIIHKRFIDFCKIYGDNFEKEQRNLYKYFVKSFGCRLAHFGHHIPHDMILLLDLDRFKTNLRLNFSVNEDKLSFTNSDINISGIGSNDLYTNESYIDKTGDMEFYLYGEFYDWLHINYYYNYPPDGNLGSTWTADNQFIYLGLFNSNLTDEMRKKLYEDKK